MKHPPLARAAKPKRIISDRELDRCIRFKVALVKRKRKKRRGGLTPRGWRKVEHRKNSPTGKTMERMMVAVNLTLAEVVFAMQRRKIPHLRLIAGSEQLFQ